MKTTITPPISTPRDKHVLPALYQSKITGCILVFNTLNKATVLANPQEAQGVYIGRETTGAIDCTDTDRWERLPSGFEIKHVQE